MRPSAVVRVSIGYEERTDRRKGAAAIYIMVDVTPADIDVGVALDHTGNGYRVDTTTAAIDITHTPAAELHIAMLF